MVFDSNGKELSRTDAAGNKYTSNGAPINGANNAAEAAPAAQNNEAEEKSVVVEAWGKGVTNSTLSGIITSAYGVKYGTDEYFAIETMVMNANPDIYGDEAGNGGRNRILDGTRHNSVIHPGDTIKLPPYDGKTATPAEGGTKTPATGGGTPAPRTGGTAPDPAAPADPVDEPDPLADEGPAVGGEKVVVNDDGTVSVTTTHESYGETYESTTVYADESRTKKLSVTEKHNTFVKTITYNYVGNSDKLDTVVSKSNAGGTWNTITDQYNYKGELSSRVYSSNGWVEFYGETKTYVDKLKKGDVTAIAPYGIRANEAAAIIKQHATSAKTAYADKNNYAGAISALMDKFYGADFRTLQRTYQNATGKTFGEDMADMGISGAYMKSYISKLRTSASDTTKNNINNIDAQSLIDTHKIKNTGFGNSDKKALKKIMELYGNKTITAQQAVAIINKMYIGADSLANALAGTKDKTLEANVLKLLEVTLV